MTTKKKRNKTQINPNKMTVFRLQSHHANLSCSIICLWATQHTLFCSKARADHIKN